jgi:protein required for attachment to host cells
MVLVAQEADKFLKEAEREAVKKRSTVVLILTMIKKTRSDHLIVVVNSQQAKFFYARGRKIHRLLYERHNKGFGSHQPISRHQGLSQHAVEVSAHFFDPRTEIKTIEKETFARELSAEIYHLMYARKYTDCILVAEPVMLGMIKKALRHFKYPIHIFKSVPIDVLALDMSGLQEKIFE